MKKEQATALLKKYSTDERSYRAVLKHSIAVQRYAVQLARKISARRKVDISFVAAAALLHDIGRFRFPPWKKSIMHGIEGARMLRKERLPEKYARVCERHLGAGITKEDIKKKKLKLPSRDYMPRTIEEKIVCYADKLYAGDRKITIKKAIGRFTRELGPEYGERVKNLHLEIQKLYKPGKQKKR